MTESGPGNRSLDALLREIARAPDAAVPSSLVGQTLGRYRLDALLGRGGMGVVYRARDMRLERDVALKLLPPELVGDAERRARFVREAKIAAQVTHPCVAAVYDVGDHDGVVFLAMELVKGRTLRSVLEDQQRGMEVHEVARIGAELARGLAKAHEAGIIHRDLKPENVIFDDEGHPKILDFGLAKLRETSGAETPSTELGRVLGTPSYMSPEQAKGRLVEAKSDVFSLGIMLYEMLAARRPFVGETTMEVLIAIDRDAPPPLAEVRAGLPASLAELVAACLDKRPSERPDARAVAATLHELASGEAAPASVPTSRRRVRGVAAIALCSAIVLAVGLRGRARTTSAPAPATSAPTLDEAFSKTGVALACPPLEATNDNQPAGWMGAAAASFLCERASMMLGGLEETTLVPAELLDLPRAPSEDLEADVYAHPKTRERAVAAAKTRAPTWLDGRVDATPERFRVAFTIRGQGGREIARGAADDRAFNHALTRAMEAAGFPVRPLTPEVRRFALAPDARDNIAAADALVGILYGTPDDRDRLVARAAAIGPAWPAIQIIAARTFSEPKPDVEPWPLDRSTPERLGLTAALRSAITNDVPLSVADDLHAFADKEKLRLGRASYLLAEASIRAPAGQSEKVRETMLALVQESPRQSDAWSRVAASSFGLPSFRPLAVAYSRWAPDNPDAWNALALSTESPDERDALSARAVALTPDMTLFASNYAFILLVEGKPTAARAVAARLLLRGERQRLVGRAIGIGVDAASVAFGAALEHARALILDLPLYGTVETGIESFVLRAFDIEELATGGTTLADAAAERFVLAEPPRLSTGYFAAAGALSLCGWVRADLAKPCVARIHALVDAGYFREGLMPVTKPLLDGLEKSVAGDLKGAAQAFRGLLGAPSMYHPRRMFEAFEKSGDMGTLESLDTKRDSKFYGGVSSGTVHGARMAAKRGDTKKARELAQRVVDAWATADIQLVAQAEMRAILAAK